MSGEPFPKSSQLARGERRYRRKVASAKDWQRIAAEKHGPCRVCCVPALNDAEYAYLIGKLGEGALERLYGVGR